MPQQHSTGNRDNMPLAQAILPTFLRKFPPLNDAIKKFKRATSGQFLIVFALLAPMLCLTAAVAIDYSKLSQTKAKAQKALDASMLATAHLKDRPLSEIQATADGVFRANFGVNEGVQLVVTKSGDQIIGAVQFTTTSVMSRLLGDTPLQIKANATAEKSSDGTLEVVFALDTTLSMKDDMPTLRIATKNFATNLIERSPANVKFGVVPFTHVVNPGAGALPSRMLDNDMQSNAKLSVHYHEAINPQPMSMAIEPCISVPDPFAPPGNSTDKDKQTFNFNKLFNFSYLDFLISPAHAQNYVPPSEMPLQGTFDRFGTFIPEGYSRSEQCWGTIGTWVANAVFIYTAPTNQYMNAPELFRRIGVGWKGCVLARSGEHDVSDSAPSAADVNTLWLPSFWLSEPSNRFITDDNHNKPASWAYMTDRTPLRYNSTTPLDIKETMPNTRGPNKGCPDPILPLTNDRNAFENYINTLSHWESGGTAVSEGVAWSWRVLSPSEPFTEGAAYGPKVRKVMIVMSDGANEILSSPNTWASTWSAYGPMYWANRHPTPWSYSNTRKFFDDRTKLACENAKKAGVEIYMVLFKQADLQARDLFQACASSAFHLLYADNPAQMEAAFSEIGRQVLSRVRLVK